MTGEHTFFPSVCGPFKKIDYIVDLKTSLGKFKRTGVTKGVR